LQAASSCRYVSASDFPFNKKTSRILCSWNIYDLRKDKLYKVKYKMKAANVLAQSSAYLK